MTLGDAELFGICLGISLAGRSRDHADGLALEIVERMDREFGLADDGAVAVVIGLREALVLQPFIGDRDRRDGEVDAARRGRREQRLEAQILEFGLGAEALGDVIGDVDSRSPRRRRIRSCIPMAGLAG